MDVSQQDGEVAHFSKKLETIIHFPIYGNKEMHVPLQDIMDQFQSMISSKGTLIDKAKQICLKLNIPLSGHKRVKKAYNNYKNGQRFFSSSPADVSKVKRLKTASAVLERSFIEICEFERETPHRFREVIVDLGVTALPGGVTYPDSAGAFHYGESGKLLSVTSNRLIHWCTSGDSVQLVEQSLDTNLLNNAVRLRLRHCSVLPGGVHIQETLNNVVILVSTNRSVHRLLLPHPSRMYRRDLVTDLHMQSIFIDVGKLSLQDAAYSTIIPGSLSPSTSTVWLSQSGETLYALAAPAGDIVVLSLPPHGTQGSMSVVELKRSSRMPTAIGGDQSPSDRALSLAIRELEEDCFIFALCQDHKLRMWSFTEQACVLEADMLDYMPACKGVKRNPGNGHRLRLAFSPNTGLCLCVYFAVPQRGQFTVLQLVAADNRRYSLEHISSLFTTQETLVDFSLTPTDIWGVWTDESSAFVVQYINLEKISMPDESNTPLVRRSKRLAKKHLQVQRKRRSTRRTETSRGARRVASSGANFRKTSDDDDDDDDAPCVMDNPEDATRTFAVGEANKPEGESQEEMRIAELKARNEALPLHLKSSYAVEPYRKRRSTRRTETSRGARRVASSGANFRKTSDDDDDDDDAPCVMDNPEDATRTFAVGEANKPEGESQEEMRIAELKARNEALPPHLKSSYAVEPYTGCGLFTQPDPPNVA